MHWGPFHFHWMAANRRDNERDMPGPLVDYPRMVAGLRAFVEDNTDGPEDIVIAQSVLHDLTKLGDCLDG